MAEIVNLNKARKNQIKKEQKKKASDNRVSFGRTKEEKSLAKSLKDKQKTDLDGKKLDD